MIYDVMIYLLLYSCIMSGLYQEKKKYNLWKYS